MSKERFDPETGKWVSHEDILNDLEEKKKKKGILSPTDESELDRLRRAKAAENETYKKGPESSLFK